MGNITKLTAIRIGMAYQEIERGEQLLEELRSIPEAAE